MKMFSPVFLGLPLALARYSGSSRHKSKNICVIKSEPKSVSHYDPDYPIEPPKKVLCDFIWCCDEGCCPWYIDLLIIISVLGGLILAWTIFDKCYLKSTKGVETEGNEYGENMMILPTNQIINPSRDGYINYGTNYFPTAETPTNVNPKQESLPTYDEATILPTYDEATTGPGDNKSGVSCD